MELKDRLKAVREALKKSQKDMAHSVGVSVTAWQNYEGGGQFPGGKVLEALARLGISINWVLTGEGVMRLEDGAKISQYASNNVGMIQAGTVSGSITQGGGEKLPDDIQELCELLRHYGHPALKANLKARLLKLKEDEEGR